MKKIFLSADGYYHGHPMNLTRFHLYDVLFFALVLVPLLYLGCGVNSLNSHDGVLPPVADPAKLVLPQGVHITGRIQLPEVHSSFFLEPEYYRSPTQLASLRASLASATDFSNFTVIAGGQEGKCDASGFFSLGNVPAAESYLFSAISPNGRIQLKTQLLITLKDGGALSDVTLDLDSTARALLFNAAFDSGKYVNIDYLDSYAATKELKTLLLNQLQASATALTGPTILTTRDVLTTVGRFVSTL